LYFFLGCELACINSVLFGCNFSFQAVQYLWNSSIDCCSLDITLDVVLDDVHEAVSSANRPCSVWFGVRMYHSLLHNTKTSSIR
jgi:hypothetical protein